MALLVGFRVLSETALPILCILGMLLATLLVSQPNMLHVCEYEQ